MANNILIGVFLLFIMAIVYWHYQGTTFAGRLFLAVTEAALVGGIADWFAVTALFRKPLGIPWYTAILPRNRDRVVEALVFAVQQELLSKNFIRQRLENVRLSHFFIEWIDGHKAAWLDDALTPLLEFAAGRLDSDQAASQVAKVLRAHSDQLHLTPAISRFVRWMLAQKKDEVVFDMLLDQLLQTMQKPAATSTVWHFLRRYTMWERRSSPWRMLVFSGLEAFDAFNLNDAAKALHQELLTILIELKQPEHRLRRWLHSRLTDIGQELEQNPAWVQAVEEWKSNLIGQAKLEEAFVEVLQAVMMSLQGKEEQSTIGTWLRQQTDTYWQLFKTNKALQDWIESYLQEILQHVIETEHALIGDVVRDALVILTKEEMNQFVEERAGDDLQWIRINGSVVGALVGFILFIWTQLVYMPFIVPIIRSWFM